VKAVILAAGDILASERLVRAIGAADVLIAADGGLRHAAMLGVHPGFVIGDFDSVTEPELLAHPAARQLRYPPAKAETDLELAIDLAEELGALSVLLAGATGSRTDQGFAALLIAARRHEGGLEMALDNGLVAAWPLKSGDELPLDFPPGTTFSILSLQGDCRLSISGARYPLDHAELRFGTGLGVSNVITAGTRVSLHEGLCVVIVEQSLVRA
jgi:thiamine pyrophosphokinase